MQPRIVGIGEYLVSGNPEDTLKTYALGSCVTVLIYDKKLIIGGMSHFALPSSEVDPVKARTQPGYYVDTGLPLFIEAMKRMGALKENIWIKLAGGANTLNTIDTFDIGKRNVTAIKKYLWKFSMGAVKEDVGGNIGRTVSLSVASGEVLVSSGQKKWSL